MDRLSLDVLQLIFSQCDMDSIKNLRLTSAGFAHLGLWYLQRHVVLVPWRDHIQTLATLAADERTRHRLEAVTFSLASIGVKSLTAAAGMEARTACRHLQARRRVLPDFNRPKHERDMALKRFPNLHEVNINFRPAAYGLPGLEGSLISRPMYNGRKRDLHDKCDTIFEAIGDLRTRTMRINFTPASLLSDLCQWAQAGPGRPARLDKLERFEVVLDYPLDDTMYRLGFALSYARSLTHLSIGSMRPGKHEGEEGVFTNQTFPSLIQLRLECTATHLYALPTILARHRTTLKYLRLGGPGYIFRKSWRPLENVVEHISLQTYLGKIHRAAVPGLERLHLEGPFVDFYGQWTTRKKVTILFHAISDDDWNVVEEQKITWRGLESHSCAPFADFVLHGGRYPNDDHMVKITRAPI